MRYYEIQETIDYRILNGDDLARLSLDEPNETVFKRIKYLRPDERDEIHMVAFDQGKVVGVASLQENPRNVTEFWVKQLSVDPEYGGRGIAAELITKTFAYADSRSKLVVPSSFTDSVLIAISSSCVEQRTF